MKPLKPKPITPITMLELFMAGYDYSDIALIFKQPLGKVKATILAERIAAKRKENGTGNN